VTAQNFFRIVGLLIVAPIMILFFGLRFAGQYLWAYASGLASSLGIGSESRALAVPRPVAGAGASAPAAYQHYLFGQAWQDARQAALLTFRGQWKITTQVWGGLTRTAFARGATLEARMVAGAIQIIGITIGFLLAAGILVLAAITQAAAIAVLVSGCLLGVYLLRGLDTAALRIRRIGITCVNPDCYKPVPYPAYGCPGCNTLHVDVRPGRFGVTRRVCGCGHKMTTLLLFGSHTMKAYCPHCRRELEESAGVRPEIVVPVFGAPGAGKTQLMTALVIGAEAAAPLAGGRVEPADDHTRRWLAGARQELFDHKATAKTGVALQRPYSFVLKPRRGRGRLLKIFDAAGEVFADSSKIDTMRFALAASTFAFVVDPLSIETVWSALGPATRSSLREVRASREPGSVFEQTIQNFLNMGVETAKASLMVAVTKADLIETQLEDAEVFDDASIRKWLVDTLKLDNMVRAMDHAFRDVRFMLTSAVPSGQGVDTSIETFLRTLLEAERFRW